jgi:hypothetical protein
MHTLPVWKFTVTSGHPEFFGLEVVPMIEELEGSVLVTSQILGESQYWVKLPAHIVKEELDTLMEHDKYSTWVVERRGALYNPPE